MIWQRFKLSSFCWLATAAEFVDYIVKKSQFVITCNYKVVAHGKTIRIKKDDVIRLKNRLELIFVSVRPPVRPSIRPSPD
jgi:hypothetical protein